MKIYGIENKWESLTHYHDTEYLRFFSLYNGIRGAWVRDINIAREEGNKHQIIIQKCLGIDFEKME